MKKVIFTRTPKGSIHMSDVTDNMIIGLLWDDGEKCQVLGFGAGYVTINIGSPNDLNRKFTFNSLYDLLSNDAVKESYVFDNKRQFFNWLIKE